MFLIIFFDFDDLPECASPWLLRSIDPKAGCEGIQKEKDFLNYYCYYGEFLVQIWSAVLFDER